MSKIQAFLASHHSYVLAAGLLGLALYQFTIGDGSAAGSSLAAAAAAVGLKLAAGPAAPATPAK